MIKQDNELEMEKMRRIESERKLSAALAQIYRLRADRKVFRWSRLAMKLELRSLNGKQKKQIDDLRTHNELLVKVVQNTRAQAKAQREVDGIAFSSTVHEPPPVTSGAFGGWDTDDLGPMPPFGRDHVEPKGKIHRVEPDFGSTFTASNRDSQSNCWVN